VIIVILLFSERIIVMIDKKRDNKHQFDPTINKKPAINIAYLCAAQGFE
jgi:hypothetical protein